MATAVAETLEDAVEATFNYMVHEGPRPVTTWDKPSLGYPHKDRTYETHPALVRNGRNHPELSIEHNGFALKPQPTKMTDFFDEDEVRTVYYPEMEALIKEHTGACRVVIFDHTLRSGYEEKGAKGPVQNVHNDYTEWSGPERVRDLLPNEAEDLFKRRFAVVQVWRGMLNPVLRSPLAMCDAQSIATEDLIPTVRPHPNRLGETYHLTYSSNHRFYYYPDMQPDEAIVFKCYDSRTDGHGSARIPPSSIPTPRRTRRRGKASRSGPWRSSTSSGAAEGGCPPPWQGIGALRLRSADLATPVLSLTKGSGRTECH